MDAYVHIRKMAKLAAIGVAGLVLLGLVAIAYHRWPLAVAYAVAAFWGLVAITACSGWIQAGRDRDSNAAQAKTWRLRVFELERRHHQ